MLPFGVQLGFRINVGTEFVPTGADSRLDPPLERSVWTFAEDAPRDTMPWAHRGFFYGDGDALLSVDEAWRI